MSRLDPLWILSASLACVLLYCASPPQPPGPEQSVEQFYRHLNDGNYTEAMSLYNAKTLDVLEDPQNTNDGGFAQWAQLETKQGTVDHVRVLNAHVQDTAATVDYEVIYRDGSTKRASVELTQEDGQWKLGLVS